MNKQIQELYETALVAAGKDKQFETTNLDVATKFAELMVEEACQAFWSEACNVSDLAHEDYHRNSKKIRQHFGVEL